MDIRIIAARKTAGMLAIAFGATAVLTALVRFMSFEAFSYICFAGFLCFFVWLVYSINLTRLKHTQQEQKNSK